MLWDIGMMDLFFVAGSSCCEQHFKHTVHHL